MIDRRIWLPLILTTIVAPTAGGAEKIAATVGSSSITERELTARIRAKLPTLSFHGRYTKEMVEKLRKELLRRLIEDELLFHEAKRLGLLPDNAAIRAFRDKQAASYGGPAKFGRLLAKYGMTWQQHWAETQRDLAVKAVLARLEAAAQIGEQEIETLYRAEPGRFLRPPEVKLRMLAFKVHPSDPDQRWREARERGRKAAALLRGGADLKRLAAHAEASEPGWMHKGRLPPEIEAAAFKMKPGEVSDPIRTLHGYSVIKVEAHRAARQIPLPEIASKLRTMLVEKRREEARAVLLKRLRAQHKVVLAN